MNDATTESTAPGHDLLHAPLTVPHDRLKVTHVDILSTSRGEAFVAQVQLDGEPFGTFENGGYGGPTNFSPVASGDALNVYRERNKIWAAYAKACVFSDERVANWHEFGNLRSEGVHEEDVAEMLLQEHDIAGFVAQSADQRRVCVRVFSTTTGYSSEIFSIDMCRLPYQPAMDDTLRRVASRQPDTRLMEGDVWQVWTGERWHDLTSPVPAEADEHQAGQPS